MNYFVYIIQSQTTSKIYIGQTNNPVKRARQHNDPNCKLGIYTKKNKGPWKLIYLEKLNSRKGAIIREKELKSGKGREFIKRKILGR